MSKTAELSQAFRAANFVNVAQFKQRYTAAALAGVPREHLPAFRLSETRGSFHRFTDYRRGGRKRHKFRVRANSPEDGLEVQDIAKKVIPEADVHIFPNGCLVEIIWFEEP